MPIEKGFFHGSGAKENLKGFKLKKKPKDACPIFKPFFNPGEQTTSCYGSSLRSTERAHGEVELEGELLMENCDVSELENSLVDESGGCNCDGCISVEIIGCCDGGIGGGFGTVAAEADLHEEVLEFGRNEDALGCAVFETVGNLGSEGSASSFFVQSIGDAATTELPGKELEDGLESGGVIAESGSCLQNSVCENTKSSSMCHPHARTLHSDSSASGVSSGGSGACGLSSVGSVGAFGWVRGRVSARSAWGCCPGCGLYGVGTLCMACDVSTHGEANSGTINSSVNLRVVRRAEFEQGTKPSKVGSRIQVGVTHRR